MKRWLHALCLIAGFATFAACRTQGLAGPISGNPGLIPAPARCQMYEGSFALTSRTKISLGRNVSPATGRFLRARIEQRTGLGGEIVAPRLLPGSGAIRLRLDPRAAIHPEGYRLAITPRAVTLNASTDAGLFYGVQSLLQMLERPLQRPASGHPGLLARRRRRGCPALRLARPHAGRIAPFLRQGRRQADARHDGLPQDEPLPLAPDRFARLAHRIENTPA